MKHITSLLPPCSQRRSGTRPAAPEGVPTGSIYSYTYSTPTAPHKAGSEPEVLVLVKLNEGPMLLGALSGMPQQEIRIGAPVRMTFPADDPAEGPGSGRHLFEPLRSPGSKHRRHTPSRMLEATAA